MKLLIETQRFMGRWYWAVCEPADHLSLFKRVEVNSPFAPIGSMIDGTPYKRVEIGKARSEGAAVRKARKVAARYLDSINSTEVDEGSYRIWSALDLMLSQL